MKTYQNLNNIMHCLKVMADEEVCEECELYNLGDVWCRDVARNAIELIKKQIPMKLVCKSDAIYNDGFSRYKEYYCPNCGEIYKDIEDYPYCHWCGQKLEV